MHYHYDAQNSFIYQIRWQIFHLMACGRIVDEAYSRSYKLFGDHPLKELFEAHLFVNFKDKKHFVNQYEVKNMLDEVDDHAYSYLNINYLFLTPPGLSIL